MNKPAKIAPDKRTLIAESLLAGESLERIYERMIASGASPASADYEMRRAEKDPLFQAAAALQRRIAKRDWALQIHGQLAKVRADGPSIPAVDKIEPARFFEDFYAANRPVVLKGLVDHWPAMTKW